MNIRILAIATGILLALAPAAIAHADETPAPATYDEYLEPVLDCTTATITFTTIHWVAPAELVEGVTIYGDWVEASRSSEVAQATGTETGDCPNWQVVEEEWVDTTIVTPTVEVAPVVSTTEKVTPSTVQLAYLGSLLLPIN
jgi:hypothetical protein